MTGLIRTIPAAALLLAALAACEPLPPQGTCRPKYDQAGRMVMGCTPDGRPITVSPAPAEPATQPVPEPAPVRSQPISDGPISASGEFGPVPTVTGPTGEPLPPPPENLTAVPRPGSTPKPQAGQSSSSQSSSGQSSSSQSSSSAPAPKPSSSTDANGLPATVAPPPPSVTSSFSTE